MSAMRSSKNDKKQEEGLVLVRRLLVCVGEAHGEWSLSPGDRPDVNATSRVAVSSESR